MDVLWPFDEKIDERLLDAISVATGYGITVEEFETEKRVYVTNFINTYDDVLENALISAKQIALTKQTFSENTERLKIEVLTNKDANKLLQKILNFEKMVVIYLGHDIEVNYEDLVDQVRYEV